MNIAIINQNGGKYLFEVPKSITLKEGECVKCDTVRGVTEGVCYADSVIVDEPIAMLIGKLTGAKFPLKKVVGKMEYQPFEKPTEDKPQPKYKVGDKVKVIKNALSSNSAKESYVGNVYEIKNAQGTDHVHGTKYGIGEMCVVYEDEIEPYTEPAPEPIKLYCVKDYLDIVTKGKVYELPDFVADFCAVKGKKVSHYDDFSIFSNRNPHTASCLAPLVARPAKVGETVRFKECHGGELEAGTLHKATAIHGETVVFECGCICSTPEVYEVLDGYQPEPEYYSGKAVCVESETQYFTVGKIYECRNGLVYTDHESAPYNNSKPTLNRKDALNRAFVKFVELVGEQDVH